MDLSHRYVAFSCFVSGCAWASIGWIIASAEFRRRDWRNGWLSAVFALEALAAWAGALAAYGAWRPGSALPMFSAGLVMLLRGARLAALAGSIVALVEYGRRRLARRALLPGRWIYALVGAWVVAAPLVLQRGWLEFGLRIFVAWPGAMIAGLFLQVATRGRRLARRPSLAVGLAALLAATIVGCGSFELAQAGIALVAVTALWLSVAGRRSRPVPAWRRVASPATFVVAVALGWFVLVGARRQTPDLGPPSPDVAQLLIDVEPEEPVAQPSALERQLERCGLAVAPILALVLAVWGLSRLPFAR